MEFIVQEIIMLSGALLTNLESRYLAGYIFMNYAERAL